MYAKWATPVEHPYYCLPFIQICGNGNIEFGIKYK